MSSKRRVFPGEKPRKGWHSRERERHYRVCKYAVARFREGLEREPVGSKRVSGAGGDGYPVDSGGEHLREDENQEGIGLSAHLKGGSQVRIPARPGPEDGLLDHSRGVMNLEDVRVRERTLLACLFR